MMDAVSSQFPSPALFLTFVNLPLSCPVPGCRCDRLAMFHYYDLSDSLDIYRGSHARLACVWYRIVDKSMYILCLKVKRPVLYPDDGLAAHGI